MEKDVLTLIDYCPFCDEKIKYISEEKENEEYKENWKKRLKKNATK